MCSSVATASLSKSQRLAWVRRLTHGSDVAHFDLHRSQHGGDIEFRAVHKDADSSHSDPLLLAVRCCGLYM